MHEQATSSKSLEANAPARAVAARDEFSDADAALVALGRWLAAEEYRFVTPTPATHALANARAGSDVARSTTDVFGWSRPFPAGLLPSRVVDFLHRAGALERRGELLASRVRASTLHDELYVHSSFPTREPDAVFFGPDTYRFAVFIESTLALTPMNTAGHIVDVGCGTGAGGIVALRAAPAPCALTLTDVSATALRFARINAMINGVAANFRQCDLFSAIEGDVDLIVANPPYLVDAKGRLYRNGGGALGGELSVRIAREGVTRLAAGGTLLLYTGSCIVNGQDLLRAEIETCVGEACARGLDLSLTYREIDPDVFGEELALPGYEAVDRIAVIGAVIRRKPAPGGRRGGVMRAARI